MQSKRLIENSGGSAKNLFVDPLIDFPEFTPISSAAGSAIAGCRSSNAGSLASADSNCSKPCALAIQFEEEQSEKQLLDDLMSMGDFFYPVHTSGGFQLPGYDFESNPFTLSDSAVLVDDVNTSCMPSPLQTAPTTPAAPTPQTPTTTVAATDSTTGGYSRRTVCEVLYIIFSVFFCI